MKKPTKEESARLERQGRIWILQYNLTENQRLLQEYVEKMRQLTERNLEILKEIAAL